MSASDALERRETHQRLAGDDGANVVEYAMLVALIIVVCLGALTVFGNNAKAKISCSSSAIVNQTGGVTC